VSTGSIRAQRASERSKGYLYCRDIFSNGEAEPRERKVAITSRAKAAASAETDDGFHRPIYAATSALVIQHLY
jgi:hypothetical protein